MFKKIFSKFLRFKLNAVNSDYLMDFYFSDMFFVDQISLISPRKK